ncbi:hypothetical protein ACNHUS_02190 [Actinomycetes bacterium M1A6_2h]
MTCHDCAAAVDHCHGTLIVHSTHVVECTDETCVELQAIRHVFVVDCTAVAGGCVCADGEGRVALAS